MSCDIFPPCGYIVLPRHASLCKNPFSPRNSRDEIHFECTQLIRNKSALSIISQNQQSLLPQHSSTTHRTSNHHTAEPWILSSFSWQHRHWLPPLVRLSCYCHLRSAAPTSRCGLDRPVSRATRTAGRTPGWSGTERNYQQMSSVCVVSLFGIFLSFRSCFIWIINCCVCQLYLDVSCQPCYPSCLLRQKKNFPTLSYYHFFDSS